MNIIKIEIANYKSIKEPICVHFNENEPTVLIGKNGSGKTNILEAIKKIAASNSDETGRHSADGISYKIYIRLSKEELLQILPDAEYSDETAVFTAFHNPESLKISAIASETLVPLLKSKFTDIKELAGELEKELKKYENELSKLSHDDFTDSQLCCYETIDAHGETTNFFELKNKVSYIIWEIRHSFTFDETNTPDSFTMRLDDNFYYHTPFTIKYDDLPFKLIYREPSLASFEKNFIIFNATAIKREITKINNKTQLSCQRITELIEKIKEQASFLSSQSTSPLHQFIQDVTHIFSSTCNYLFSDNGGSYFKKFKGEIESKYLDHSKLIFDSYLKSIYKGNDRDKLLSNRSGYKIPENERRSFEEYLNNNLPSFENGMFSQVSVSAHDKGISIYLNENTGETVPLEHTSAGRRWYFTYFFLKNTLKKGDTLIIDEPAAMLHPTAQKEILADITELSKNGIRVIYSTHSPYLVPQKYMCAELVWMGDSTRIDNLCGDTDAKKKLREITDDVFKLEEIYEAFNKCSDPNKIALNCYEVVMKKWNNTKDAQKALLIGEDAIKSWKSQGKKHRNPSFENIIRIAIETDTDILELLKV